MKRYSIAVIFSICSFLLTAQPLVLQVDDAVSLALENNINLQLAAQDASSAQRTVSNSWNLFLPSIQGGLSSYGSSQILSDNSFDLGDVSPSVTGSLQVALTLNPAVSDQLDLYDITYETKQVSLAQAQKEIERSVKKLFYYLIAEQQNLLLQENTIALSQKRYEMARTNFANGYTSELEVLSAQLTVESQQSAYRASSAAYDSQITGFKVLLGIPFDQELELSGVIGTPDRAALDVEELEGYINENYALQLLDLNSESLKVSREITRKSSLLPSLSILGKYQTTTGDLSDISNSWYDAASYSVSVSIPIDGYISGSRIQESLTAIDEQLAALALSREQTMIARQQSLRSSVDTLQTISSQIEAAQSSVGLSQKIYDMTGEQYRAGMKELLDLEEAQSDLFSSQQQLLFLNYQYLSSLIDLSYDLQIGIEQLNAR